MNHDEKVRTTAIMAAILATRNPPTAPTSVTLGTGTVENLVKVAHQLLTAAEELQSTLGREAQAAALRANPGGVVRVITEEQDR